MKPVQSPLAALAAVVLASACAGQHPALRPQAVSTESPPVAAPAEPQPVAAVVAVAPALPPPPPPTPPAEEPLEEPVAEAPAEPSEPERDPEAESRAPIPEAIPGVRYTADIDDAALERLWTEAPEQLGSLSIGFADAGRLINAQPMPEGPHWTIVDPSRAFATEETLAYLTTAISHVAAQSPETPPLRVNHLSKPEGGWIRPHRSHQSGRDVDLAFYYLPGGPDRGAWAVRENFDLARNWALVRSLATLTDVQLILVDRKIIKRLYEYALKKGEDPGWLNSLFRAGRGSLVQHARRHRDHYHVRFYNPRAQELGRRVQPLMPKGRPDHNVVVHRVRSGDCLGSIAHRYDTTVSAIRRANGLRGNLIRAGRTLLVPLRGPCVNCPVAPEVVVPPRRLPPAQPAVAAVDHLPTPGASGPAGATAAPR